MFPYSYFGVLRPAAKYDAAEIRDLLVPVLKASFPAVSEDWHHLQTVILAADIPESPGEDYLLESMQFIRLAEACNVPDVLPVAFYELSCLFDDMDPEANFYHESFSGAMPSELVHEPRDEDSDRSPVWYLHHSPTVKDMSCGLKAIRHFPCGKVEAVRIGENSLPAFIEQRRTTIVARDLEEHELSSQDSSAEHG
ncbi:hypothetical protein BV25DRAFT_1829773 [Artomyces pyxidatus]|uniref:Uncharacterized protein n=1 Tax=Artomyces pyxidatus TaxID=48021 RepID=A0ACB8SRB7_9AGAM|nr:hypothetical protein BV25DRAFT_1829773 [Artomyces pyxidatus]